MNELVDVASDAYHDDLVAETPTLSKSVIHLLLNASPAHAREAHPKLNPNFMRKVEEKFDLGTVVHDLFLEGYDRVAIVPFDSWRKQAAQDLRDEARARGQIPMLASQAEQVQDMLVVLNARLGQFDLEPELFKNGTAEKTLVWEDRGVTCRARLDYLHDDHSTIDDLKTSSRLAKPAAWCRTTLWSIGADLQQAFYVRGCKAILGVEPDFRFVIIETEPPHEISVISVDPYSIAVANRKIDYALDLWRDCLEKDEWPGYDRRIHYAEMPPWVENEWIAREVNEAAA